ncbi:duf4042 domain containing protein [Dermatophagoides farinae]|uniref:Duf4042 domain containing protein n=1 Tax=Dermatophagoides farinae TaxID=6954 RepID=A0A9D4NV56_DERFA|nr:duf4042 domain containing protein [Dermatophagoides farinae]
MNNHPDNRHRSRWGAGRRHVSGSGGGGHLIFTGLNNLSVQDGKDSKRIIALLESLHSLMEMNKSSITTTKQDNGTVFGDFSQELSRLNQFLFDIKTLLNNNNVENYQYHCDLFRLQNLLLKSFNILLKTTKIIDESPLYGDILEHLIDYLIQMKIIICKSSGQQRNDDNIIVTLNQSCLLLLKCIYLLCSKFTISYGNNLRKTNVSGKLIGILRCFMFYGLNKYDLESYPVNLYPSPISQFMMKDNGGLNSKKRRNNSNRFDDDEIFDEIHNNNSPNLSTSEYSSSELDESISTTTADTMTIRREFQNKKSFVKIRMFAYECLRTSLDVFDIRTIFGFWSFLFPDSSSSWPYDQQFSLLTTISNDTSNRNNCSILILVYKVLSLIVSITPYHKINDNILNQLFSQNSYLIDNKVTQIKNLSLALYVKIFSMQMIPSYLELWIIETKIGCDTMNKIFIQCYEFIDNQDYILLIIESIKLFISILRHSQFAIRLLSMKTINFNIHTLCMDLSIRIVEMDKAFNNSVLQTLMCKFIHTIGTFLKDLSSDDKLEIFPNHESRIEFIKEWYLKIIDSKIFYQALVEQDMAIVQNSSQITMINVISLIPEKVFVRFDQKIRFNIISILISLSKIDHDDNQQRPETVDNDDDENELWIYTKSTSIRCLSILQSYDCFVEDLVLIMDLIDICLDVFHDDDDESNHSYRRMAKKKQIFLFEHTLWALANILDCVKKNQLETIMEYSFLIRIGHIMEKLYTEITHHTDDMFINLVRNSSIIIYLILCKQNSHCFSDSDLAMFHRNKSHNDDEIDQSNIQMIIKHMYEILAKKKSYKLQWNICIGFSYLFPMENFIKLCGVDMIEHIMDTLYQTFLNTVNHKVQSYSIYTISCIYELNIFQKHLSKLWSSLIEKFIDNLLIVPIHNRRTWLDRFAIAIEKFFNEYVQQQQQQQNDDDDVQKNCRKLAEFLAMEIGMKNSDFDDEIRNKLEMLYNIVTNKQTKKNENF